MRKLKGILICGMARSTDKNMYENGSGYESICEAADINYEDYRED